MHEGQEELPRTYAGQHFCDAVPLGRCPCKPCPVACLWRRTSKAKVSATSAPPHKDLHRKLGKCFICEGSEAERGNIP